MKASEVICSYSSNVTAVCSCSALGRAAGLEVVGGNWDEMKQGRRGGLRLGGQAAGFGQRPLAEATNCPSGVSCFLFAVSGSRPGMRHGSHRPCWHGRFVNGKLQRGFCGS